VLLIDLLLRSAPKSPLCFVRVINSFIAEDLMRFLNDALVARLQLVYLDELFVLELHVLRAERVRPDGLSSFDLNLR